jgi:GNAT superfamily N-acetyltransferase
MKKAVPINQPEKGNPLWQQLLSELAKMFTENLELVFPKEWNKQYFSLFKSIEEYAFRQELRYSYEEIAKILENPDLVFCFVTVDSTPQILLLGYSIPDEKAKSFYLDTLAVRRRGEGIGHIVMSFLTRWARTKNFNAIILDTEKIDEKGFPLPQFYAKHGFEVIAKTEINITMKCLL